MARLPRKFVRSRRRQQSFCVCQRGWPRTSVRMWRWRRPVSTGSRYGTSWMRENFELVLANASHVKNVPGRKTDVNDAMWLAELLAHGLIRGSFVPDTQTQEMRTLLRTRKQLVRENSRHILRVQKTLEDANIKLDSVLADVLGKSGRAIIEALIAGETNTAKLGQPRR